MADELLTTAIEDVEAAEAKMDAEDYAGAMQLLQQARQKSDAQVANLLDYYLAVCAAKLGDATNALQWLDMFLVRAYDDPEVIREAEDGHPGYVFKFHYAAYSGRPIPP